MSAIEFEVRRDYDGYWEVGACSKHLRSGWIWEKLKTKRKPSAMKQAPAAKMRLARQLIELIDAEIKAKEEARLAMFAVVLSISVAQDK